MKFRIPLAVILLTAATLSGQAPSTDPVLSALRSVDSTLAKALETTLAKGSHGIDRDLALGLARLAKQSGLDSESTAALILATARKSRELRHIGLAPLRVRQQLYLEGSQVIGESKKYPQGERIRHIHSRFAGKHTDSDGASPKNRQRYTEKRRDEKRYAGARGGTKDKKGSDDTGSHNR